MPGARASLPDRAAAIRRVFLGLLAANVAVVAAKVVIGVQTGSRSVLGDAIPPSVRLAGAVHLDRVIVRVEPC
jgi:divalent metal cation (Fe/Co/Zn/Cd) transporter